MSLLTNYEAEVVGQNKYKLVRHDKTDSRRIAVRVHDQFSDIILYALLKFNAPLELDGIFEFSTLNIWNALLIDVQIQFWASNTHHGPPLSCPGPNGWLDGMAERGLPFN